MSETFTVRDVARAVYGSDDMPAGIALKGLETTTQIALQIVIGKNAAFSKAGSVRIDLGNGFALVCRVEPA
ncbi:hypothetical protein CKO44_16040 [Rubrivivax gelatinosus]|uniref:hypothetical protein n=1 Tax=Rubrivivax gelatinosus TaxID=28068 RepID=UPI0019082ABB|nr:hypothetical protein [Rubrivivax gelatinosus]MBK1614980.1 hypothetical protein [Rubrivivax gelatinosus]MBZ8142972.1 hypothetical protein [Rubrivivax gelatinosus]